MDKEVVLAIGLMSGTSLDGIDAVLLYTDGQNYISRPTQISKENSSFYLPYPPSFKTSLQEVIAGKREHLSVEKELTILHAQAVNSLLSRANLKPEEIKVIGFHGQTIIHRPEEGITWQIGDGSLLCQLTKINVVNDFRRRDLAAGGQGAPLLPLYHFSLVRSFCFNLLNQTKNEEKKQKIKEIKKEYFPIMVINIGGVSNITYIENFHLNDQKMINSITAFDTGPGNALINDWIKLNNNDQENDLDYDQDGEFAKNGKVDQKLVDDWLTHSYFSKLPPKSLDRNTFYSLIQSNDHNNNINNINNDNNNNNEEINKNKINEKKELNEENENKNENKQKEKRNKEEEWKKFEIMKGKSKEDGAATLSHFSLLSLLLSPFLLSSSPSSSSSSSLSPSFFSSFSSYSSSSSSLFSENILLNKEKLPQKWIIAGGGRKNKFLINKLQELITEKIGFGKVLLSEEMEWDGDMMEGEGFAYLAVRSIRGMAISIPSTTGCAFPSTGGAFHSFHSTF